MNSSDITVIIPTYNRGRTIERAIKSVLNQTYGPMKIIVVDDASTDDTEERVRNLMNSHSNLAYYKQPQNAGACAARNKGIELSQTLYIAFLDSDDEWYVDKIEKQVEFLQELNADVVVCSVMRVESDRSMIYPESHHAGDLHKQLLRGNFISTGMVFGKKECFSEGFDINLPRLQDWDIMLRVTKKYRVYHQHIPLAAYYIQSDSISMNHMKLKKASKIVYEKYRSEFEQDPIAMAHICSQCAISEIMTDGNDAGKWISMAMKSKVTPKNLVIWIVCKLGLQKTLKEFQMRRLSKRCKE